MFRPGDVIKCDSDHAAYPKWHLCVSDDGHFIYLNSPKLKAYAGDYAILASDVPFIPAHVSGQSIISCRNVMKKSRADLMAAGATHKGRISPKILGDLLIFVDGNPVLSEDDQQIILNGLGDWVGV